MRRLFSKENLVKALYLIYLFMIAIDIFFALLASREIAIFGFRDGVRTFYEKFFYSDQYPPPIVSDEKNAALIFELEQTHNAYTYFFMLFFMLACGTAIIKVSLNLLKRQRRKKSDDIFRTGTSE